MKTKLIALCLAFLPVQSFAETSEIRCNKEQSICEIRNKRTTIGDKVAIFSEDGFLIAVGVITKIRDTVRTFEIKKSYARILRSHRAQVINDSEARDPEKFFKVFKDYETFYAGVKLGLLSVGIGNSFTASNFEAIGMIKWKYSTFFSARISYLGGDGEASAKLQGIPNTSFSLSAVGATAGVTQILFPYQTINLKTSIEVGAASASLASGADFNIETILNDRIIEGTVLQARGEIAASYKWDDYILSLGVDVLYLHRSINTGLSLSFLLPL